MIAIELWATLASHGLMTLEDTVVDARHSGLDAHGHLTWRPVGPDEILMPGEPVDVLGVSDVPQNGIHPLVVTSQDGADFYAALVTLSQVEDCHWDLGIIGVVPEFRGGNLGWEFIAGVLRAMVS